MDPRPWPNRVWYRFCRWICRVVSVVLFRFRFDGADNLPEVGGALVLSNHQSFLDPAFVGQCHHRRMNFVARESLNRSLIYRLIAGPLDPIPIDRDGMGLSGIKEMLKRAKRGEIVVLFPEGTRTKDGELGELKSGFAALCKRAKLPIIPAALDGAYQAWPRGKKLPRPNVVQMEFGKPILPEVYANWDDDQLVAEVQRRMDECLQRARQGRQQRSKHAVTR